MTIAQFYAWNPIVGADCSNLWPGTLPRTPARPSRADLPPHRLLLLHPRPARPRPPDHHTDDLPRDQHRPIPHGADPPRPARQLHQVAHGRERRQLRLCLRHLLHHARPVLRLEPGRLERLRAELLARLRLLRRHRRLRHRHAGLVRGADAVLLGRRGPDAQPAEQRHLGLRRLRQGRRRRLLRRELHFHLLPPPRERETDEMSYLQKFAERNGIGLDELFAWNRALDGGAACDSAFWLDYWYCVGVSA